jgi:hypothetical protein
LEEWNKTKPNPANMMSQKQEPKAPKQLYSLHERKQMTYKVNIITKSYNLGILSNFDYAYYPLSKMHPETTAIEKSFSLYVFGFLNSLFWSSNITSKVKKCRENSVSIQRPHDPIKTLRYMYLACINFIPLTHEIIIHHSSKGYQGINNNNLLKLLELTNMI